MSRSHARSVEMVEQQLKRIAKSSYPDSDFCEGMIQANLAHGFINQVESIDLMQRVVDAVSERRRVLHQQNVASQVAESLKLYRRAS
jgi:hypothetical protein